MAYVNCKACSFYSFIERRAEGEPGYNTLDKELVPVHFCTKYDSFIDASVVEKFNRGDFAASRVRESESYAPVRAYSRELGEDDKPLELAGEGWLRNSVWTEFLDPRKEIQMELRARAEYCNFFRSKSAPKKGNALSKEEFRALFLKKK